MDRLTSNKDVLDRTPLFMREKGSDTYCYLKSNTKVI